jgi:hypothetical protein
VTPGSADAAVTFVVGGVVAGVGVPAGAGVAGYRHEPGRNGRGVVAEEEPEQQAALTGQLGSGDDGPAARIDTTVAHPARVYDYWLGGKDNFAADREAAERVLAVTPGLRFRVRANRALVARAVRYLVAEAGIRPTAASPEGP